MDRQAAPQSFSSCCLIKCIFFIVHPSFLLMVLLSHFFFFTSNDIQLKKMPATTELKLFSNCWHFLFFKYPFLYLFGMFISTQLLVPRRSELSRYNARYLGLSISTQNSERQSFMIRSYNTQFLGLFIFTFSYAAKKLETSLLQCPVSWAFHFYWERFRMER